MSGSPSTLDGTGLEVLDIQDDPDFARRVPRPRDPASQINGLQRLAKAFVESPQTLLQELVEAAVDLCDADSAGISLQGHEGTDEAAYTWVATAGKYARFLNAQLPAFPSACSVCIQRARPQIFRVSQLFFDTMGIQADTVTDGLLLPWEVDGTSGTIWIMAHGRREAFDTADCRLMETLANFAVMAVRQQKQQQLALEQAQTAAAAAMANDLAHQINNPLQSLTNCVFLAEKSITSTADQEIFDHMAEDLDRLSTLTRKILSLQ